jgi:4-hydroxy 2-oxovalerate aldolase
MALSLLDCTLRDGGFVNDFDFGYDNILSVAQNLIDSKIDIIEMGFLESNVEYDKNRTIFPTIDIFKTYIIDKLKLRDTKICLMIQYPNYNIDDLPNNEGVIDLIRICPRYSELKDSLNFIKQVAKKGYNVSIQPAVVARYTVDELNLLIDTANEIEAFSLYIVDTYGYLEELDIEKLATLYNSKLNSNIKIGFHGHNNTNMAYTNSKHFFNHFIDNPNRNIVIDSTVTGMGQGPGNLQTELWIPWLNKRFEYDKYDLIKILETCDIIEQYNNIPIWGYSIVDLIGALTKVSFKYTHYFRQTSKMFYKDIYELCLKIPRNDDMPARFNVENAKKVLAMKGSNE